MAPSDRPSAVQVEAPGPSDVVENFDALEALENRATRIADMVQRFEQLLERIGEFIEDREPVVVSDQSSQAVLDMLADNADHLFEGILQVARELGPSLVLVEAPSEEGSGSGPSLNILL